MQQTNNHKTARLSAMCYFLGLGFALGVASFGIILVHVLNNITLGLVLGAVIGLAIGGLALLTLGKRYIAMVERHLDKRQARQHS
jgi:hypothetical protein